MRLDQFKKPVNQELRHAIKTLISTDEFICICKKHDTNLGTAKSIFHHGKRNLNVNHAGLFKELIKVSKRNLRRIQKTLN